MYLVMFLNYFASKIKQFRKKVLTLQLSNQKMGIK